MADEKKGKEVAVVEVEEKPATVSWKACWSILGALVTAAAGYLPHLVGWPTYTAPAIAVVIAAGVVACAHLAVHTTEMFEQVRDEDKTRIVHWITAAAVAHIAWTVALQLRPDLWAGAAAALAVLAGTEYGLARAQEWMLNHPQRPDLPGHDTPPAEEDQHAYRVVKAALKLAHVEGVRIAGPIEPVGHPDDYGVTVDLQENVRTAKDTSRITPKTSENLAIALSEILNTPIMSDWVQITPQRQAGRHSMLVVTEDVMARVHPYTDNPTWTSIREPMFAGYGMDGKPRHLTLNRHGQIVGGSGGGKSGFIHCIIGHLTRSADAHTIIAGTEKLYETMAGWLDAYADTGLQLPFTIVSGQQDLTDMLAGVMRAARARQRIPMANRKRLKNLQIIIDEASFALDNTKTKSAYQGTLYTASQLAAMILKGGKSGGAHLLLASQRSTNDNWGDAGGTISTNFEWGAVFRSNDPAEIGRVTGNYTLPQPPHPGSYYLNAGDGEYPALLKGQYIQEVDPNRAHLHDGLTLTDVAHNRQTLTHEPLDDTTAEALGDTYLNRHQHMGPELEAYLTGEPTTPNTATTTADNAKTAALARLNQIAPIPPTQNASITTLAGHKSRAQRIADIVRTSPRPLQRADILTQLHKTGDHTASEQVVTNALTRLHRQGTLNRTNTGYTTENSHTQ